jgi:hypothetical protein
MSLVSKGAGPMTTAGRIIRDLTSVPLQGEVVEV